jgi:hypothetical protein
MATTDIPDNVANFIRSHVNSVEFLEVLLLLQQERARTWSGDSVAAELRIQPRSAATRLAALKQIGAAKITDGGAFRFDETCPLCPAIEALAKAYQTHRVSIIQLIFSRPHHNGAEAFANAFLIGGKGKPDG